MLRIVYKRKFYYAFSLILFILAVIALSVWGLRSGIDFTGGSSLQVSFKEMALPSSEQVKTALSTLGLDEIITQTVGNDGMILKFKTVDEAKHQEILKNLQQTFAPSQVQTSSSSSNIPVAVEGASGATISNVVVGNGTGPRVEEVNFESIGPAISQELKTKTFYAIIVVILAIVAYIAFAFRKVGRPVSSWKYGVIAVIALIHDAVITIGVFAVLGHFFGVEVDTSFVAAVLTVLGF